MLSLVAGEMVFPRYPFFSSQKNTAISIAIFTTHFSTLHESHDSDEEEAPSSLNVVVGQSRTGLSKNLPTKVNSNVWGKLNKPEV